MKVATRCEGSLRFAHGEGAARVVMDAKPEAGGRGEAFTPVERAVRLSIERFCGVSALPGKTAAIRHELDFRPFESETS